jgi:hypothetical protein
MKFTSRWLYAITFVIGATQAAHAQVITSTEIERGLTYPGPSANGFESPSQRYSYKATTDAFIYANGSAQQLRYLDYLDRLDRALKFGYRIPVDPYCASPAPVVETNPEVHSSAVSGGGFFGFFRRR